jgi:hypothetical protein
LVIALKRGRPKKFQLHTVAAVELVQEPHQAIRFVRQGTIAVDPYELITPSQHRLAFQLALRHQREPVHRLCRTGVMGTGLRKPVLA